MLLLAIFVSSTTLINSCFYFPVWLTPYLPRLLQLIVLVYVHLGSTLGSAVTTALTALSYPATQKPFHTSLLSFFSLHNACWCHLRASCCSPSFCRVCASTRAPARASWSRFRAGPRRPRCRRATLPSLALFGALLDVLPDVFLAFFMSPSAARPSASSTCSERCARRRADMVEREARRRWKKKDGEKEREDGNRRTPSTWTL